MATKFEEFEKALIGLCISHGVQISTSAYDSIQVWDRDDGEDALYSGLEDKTKAESDGN